MKVVELVTEDVCVSVRAPWAIYRCELYSRLSAEYWDKGIELTLEKRDVFPLSGEPTSKT